MEDDNPLTVLRYFLDSGVLDDIHPHVIVLESVERYANKRFTRYKTKTSMSKNDFTNYYLEHKKNGTSDFSGILPGGMFKANSQLIISKMINRSNEKKLSREVYRETLTKDFFTDKEREKILLFYHEDLWKNNTNIDFEKMDSNLSEIATELGKRNIKLVVMINVDKLDLYYPYIANNEQNLENTFMDDFSNYVNGYVYINTKDIIREMIEKGEKDVYWQDDTHWSWKAQHCVVDYMMDKIKKDL